MRCEAVQDRLSRLIDDELPGWQHGFIQAHITHCEGCRRRLDRLLATRQAYRLYTPEAVPQGFTHRLEQRLAHPPQANPAQRSRPWRLATALGLLCILATVFWPAPPISSPIDDQPVPQVSADLDAVWRREQPCARPGECIEPHPCLIEFCLSPGLQHSL